MESTLDVARRAVEADTAQNWRVCQHSFSRKLPHVPRRPLAVSLYTQACAELTAFAASSEASQSRPAEELAGTPLFVGARSLLAARHTTLARPLTLALQPSAPRPWSTAAAQPRCRAPRKPPRWPPWRKPHKRRPCSSPPAGKPSPQLEAAPRSARPPRWAASQASSSSARSPRWRQPARRPRSHPPRRGWRGRAQRGQGDSVHRRRRALLRRGAPDQRPRRGGGEGCGSEGEAAGCGAQPGGPCQGWRAERGAERAGLEREAPHQREGWQRAGFGAGADYEVHGPEEQRGWGWGWRRGACGGAAVGASLALSRRGHTTNAALKALTHSHHVRRAPPPTPAAPLPPG